MSCNCVADLLQLARLPALRELNLQGNCVAHIDAPDTATPGFAKEFFPSLEDLDLSFNRLWPGALRALGQLPRLRHLSIAGEI